MLKETSEITAVVTVIFHQSYGQDILPEDWLNANVSAIYKKGETASPANYRPVYVTYMHTLLTVEHMLSPVRSILRLITSST